MQRLFSNLALPVMLAMLAMLAMLLWAVPPASAQGREADYYKLETLPIPEDLILEVGGLAVLPDGGLGVATRRGEVWIVENAAMAGQARPHFTRFAHGLHEPLGLAYRDGALYAAQRGELTRLRDTDGDGRADRYESVYSWPLEGNYHEYSYGPFIRPNGQMLVTLNLGWIGFGASLSPWRGWMLAITPDGRMTPVATGMRSPAGVGFDLDGEVFYAENQGDWVGSGYITHVERGDFVGNPAGLRWTDDPASPLRLKPTDIPDTGRPLFEVAQEVPALKPPAVWFPHTIMGISTSAILADGTGGAFGPFAGQLLVGDQGHSKIMRVFLEKVQGVYQGAVFPFREGFASGVLRMVWGHGGALYVGQTSRGWDATGKAPFALQRLTWTGRTPFEVASVQARPDGFELAFTLPVDPQAAADIGSYAVTGFTYKYHQEYGSPIINRADAPVRSVVVSADGRSARLLVDGLREGYIHELKMAGVRDAGGAPLLHDVAYYTLNRLPDGERMPRPSAVPAATATPPAAHPQVGSVADADALPKRMTTLPDAWNGPADVTVTIGTEPGLRFDVESVEVRARSRVKLVFNNNDDMLHNVVITAPGAADAVAEAALGLGLSGHDQHYVPDAAAILAHTNLLAPESSETIYFVAPDTPGDYTFVCTFPGHAITMRGLIKVVSPDAN